MSELYVIFARKKLSKCPNSFNDICSKIPEIYMIVAQKIF